MKNKSTVIVSSKKKSTVIVTPKQRTSIEVNKKASAPYSKRNKLA